ncbi:MAG: PCI domain-containing protein, partial [Candidatus Helarchaeota archaeon]|nr:PCI domain-containing protein [Candidatus Helarchaeota archaeon]
MPKQGVKTNSEIEYTLDTFKELINTTISGLKSPGDLYIQFAELDSLFKRTYENIEYKIEGLSLIITELLNLLQIDQANKIYSKYTTKLKELISEIDESAKRLREAYLDNTEIENSTLKSYKKRFTTFEKDWKNQRKKFLNDLKELKKKIETHFNKWVDATKQNIEKYLTKLKTFTNNTEKGLSNFSELLEQKKFIIAERIIINTRARAKSEFKIQREAIKQTPSDLTSILGELISKWKSKIHVVEIELSQLIDSVYKQLQTAVVEENLSKLRQLTSEFVNNSSNVSSLIERKMLIMAEELFKEMQTEIPAEFDNQRRKLEQLTPELIPLSADLINKWRNELNTAEKTIITSLSTLNTRLEAEQVEESTSNLERFSDYTRKKISTLSDLITQEKFTNADKEIRLLENEMQTEFEKQHERISQISQNETVTSKLSNQITKWKEKLEKIETEIQNSFTSLQSEYIQLYTPKLLNKIDRFIKQNIDLLNKLIDYYQMHAMNQLKSYLTSPTDTIHQIFDDQKKTINQEIKTKADHIQLVFARYEKYPLDEKKQQWANQLKAVQNRFNNFQTKILSLIEEREQINHILDKYYELAQPAYGYKIPIQNLSEAIDIPVDKLENLFVDLISNKIISGEIDPVTKVIVLAPRVSPTKKSKELIHFRCMVCNLIIDPSKEETVHCQYCNSPAHRTHLIEWLKIKGTCPNC